MKQYKITNQTSGECLGIYEGETRDDALDALARDAGYPQYCDLPYDVLCDDLIVTEIEETR
jgi:hypothetical protein